MNKHPNSLKDFTVVKLLSVYHELEKVVYSIEHRIYSCVCVRPIGCLKYIGRFHLILIEVQYIYIYIYKPERGKNSKVVYFDAFCHSDIEDVNKVVNQKRINGVLGELVMTQTWRLARLVKLIKRCLTKLYMR